MGGSSVDWWSVRKLRMYLEKQGVPYDPAENKEQLIKRVRKAIVNQGQRQQQQEPHAHARPRPRTMGNSTSGGRTTTDAARSWENSRACDADGTLPKAISLLPSSRAETPGGSGGGALVNRTNRVSSAGGGNRGSLTGGRRGVKAAYPSALATAGRRTSTPLVPTRPLRTSRKICFLDVDGVLNTHHNGRSLSGKTRPNESQLAAIQNDIHQVNLKRLARSIKESGSVIVLSSAWRLVEDHCRVITTNLRNEGCNMISSTGLVQLGMVTSDGKTINCMAKARCVEIMNWLSDFGEVESWAAVDDMDLWTAGGPSFRNHFVHTKPHFGLTDADADQLTRILTGGGDSRSGRRSAPVVVPPQLQLSSHQPSEGAPKRRSLMRLFF